MPDIYDGDYLWTDLKAIAEDESTGNDADLIEAFLDQVAESVEATWALLRWPGEHAPPHFNASGVQALQSRGFNCYRVRPLSRRLKKYRILFAFDGRSDEIHLLAVVRRDADLAVEHRNQGNYYDYEHDHPISRRVCDEYERLRIPKIC